MGPGAPLLNEYKEEFFWKRFPQTVLGGPKFRIGYEAPVYVYISQLLLFLTPWVIGGIFTTLVVYAILDELVGCIVNGAVITLFVLLLLILSAVRVRKKASVSPLVEGANVKALLAEDDEVDFESCCGLETTEFIVPGKKYKINILIHGLAAGVMNGLLMSFLLPSNLNTLYNNIGATVILFIFGWLTLCIAHYSLICHTPPEWATYRALDHYEISALMRPFYIVVCCSFHLVYMLNKSNTDFLLVNQVLHILFVFLPLLWTFGVLPPLDALWVWLSEQALVFLFGGSHMASDSRLVTLLLLSVAVYLGAYFIPHGLASLIIMAVFGYLLSIDVGGLGSQLLRLCCGKRMSPSTMSAADGSYPGFMWHWTVREAAFHLLMVSLLGGVTAVMGYFRSSIPTELASYLGYAVIAVCVLQLIFSEVQKVYVLFGLWRNKLFPASVQRTALFRKRKRMLNVIGYLRRLVVNIVAPLLMLVYLCVTASPAVLEKDTTSNTSIAATVLASMRAYRIIWQNTHNALFEISIVHVITLALPNDTTWTSLGCALQLLIIGLCRDRVAQLLNKLYFYMLVMVMAWVDKKQRHRATIPLMAVSVFLFPLILTVIMIATALSAPLLPLFTLPLFLIGYPRGMRSWPAPVGSSANVGPDTVYYRHMAPQLARALRTAFANGSLGEASAGRHYLVRYQDRLAWVFVLERGYAYCTVSIKGLELQETSCHTVEAARVDDIFESTFEMEKVPCCLWNKYAFNVLRPYDSSVIQTYSDARNVLTGVIDSPDTLRAVASGFMKTLTWVILKHCVKINQNRSTKDTIMKKTSDNGVNKSNNANHFEVESHMNSKSHQKEIVTNQTYAKHRPQSAKSNIRSRKNSRQSSVVSLADSVWSDDSDSLMMESLGNKKKVNLNTHQQKTTEDRSSLFDIDNLLNDTVTSKNTEVSYLTAGATKTPHQYSDNFGFSSDDPFDDIDFGLPAADISKPNKQLPPINPLFSTPQVDASKSGIDLSVLQLQSPYSSAVNIPTQWQNIPFQKSQLSSVMDLYSKDWFKHVISILDLSGMANMNSTDVKTALQQDDVLHEIYAQFIVACYTVVNVLGVQGMDAVSMGTSHVYKMYTGDIPWSLACDWVKDDKELYQCVVQAYRYAVKLGIDSMLLGEVSSHEELQEYLEEYEQDWYIGNEKDADWEKAVQNSKPNLFSLGFNAEEGTYTSRVLSGQDVPLYMGSLNGEAVRGQWANLSLELLYMTNDDEERYSIQAHAAMLRNLTVQAADPPLGYPVYASEPISIPTL